MRHYETQEHKAAQIFRAITSKQASSALRRAFVVPCNGPAALDSQSPHRRCHVAAPENPKLEQMTCRAEPMARNGLRPQASQHHARQHAWTQRQRRLSGPPRLTRGGHHRVGKIAVKNPRRSSREHATSTRAGCAPASERRPPHARARTAREQRTPRMTPPAQSARRGHAQNSHVARGHHRRQRLLPGRDGHLPTASAPRGHHRPQMSPRTPPRAASGRRAALASAAPCTCVSTASRRDGGVSCTRSSRGGPAPQPWTHPCGC